MISCSCAVLQAASSMGWKVTPLGLGHCCFVCYAFASWFSVPAVALPSVGSLQNLSGQDRVSNSRQPIRPVCFHLARQHSSSNTHRQDGNIVMTSWLDWSCGCSRIRVEAGVVAAAASGDSSTSGHFWLQKEQQGPESEARTFTMWKWW